MVDTTLTPDARIDPPFKDVPIGRGGFFSDPWVQWFTSVADRMTKLSAGSSVASGFITYTGTSTTDGSGVFTATWPTAFPNSYMGLTIVNTDPAYPGGVLTPTTITLSSYTGTLSKTDNLYPTPTLTLQAGVTFNWVVQGA